MQRLYHSLSLKSKKNLPVGHQIQAPVSFGILNRAFNRLLNLHIGTNGFFCFSGSYQGAAVAGSYP